MTYRSHLTVAPFGQAMNALPSYLMGCASWCTIRGARNLDAAAQSELNQKSVLVEHAFHNKAWLSLVRPRSAGVEWLCEYRGASFTRKFCRKSVASSS